jgi:hypothetical protein
MEGATPLFANGKQSLGLLPFGGSTDTVARAPNEMHGWMPAASPPDPADIVPIERDAPFALAAGFAAKLRTAIKRPAEQRTNPDNRLGLTRPNRAVGLSRIKNPAYNHLMTI